LNLILLAQFHLQARAALNDPKIVTYHNGDPARMFRGNRGILRGVSREWKLTRSKPGF
jgi:hypothetical protein